MLQQSNNNQPAAETVQQSAKTPEYVRSVRDGAVGASIFLAERKDGSKGHFFKLSRSYKPNDQSEFKYSENFYPRNGESIATVATQAAELCKELDKKLEK